MEYQFTHYENTMMGKMEREFHKTFLTASQMLETISINDIESHSSMEEVCNSWVICRDIVVCVINPDQVRDQILQRLIEAKVQRIRAKGPGYQGLGQGEEYWRSNAKVNVFSFALETFWSNDV